MTNALFKDYIPALLAGDTVQAEEINEQISEDDRLGFFLFVAAFFSTMLDERFGKTVTYDDIRAFVGEMEYDYRDADPPIKPLMIEGTLRGVCLPGEEARLEEVPVEEQFRAYTLVIKKVALQSPNVTENLNEFIAKAATRHEDMLRDIDA